MNRQQRHTTFFNFHNDQTYHCFVWVQRGGLGDVNALLDDAFEDVERSDWFSSGIDVCLIARDELNYILMFAVEEALRVSIQDGPESGDVDKSSKSFEEGLLALALREVCFLTVAEALLRAAGRWNSDPNPPDLFPLPPEFPHGE
jgi:hypothetical protein